MSNEKKGIFSGFTVRDWIIGVFTCYLWILYKMHKNGVPIVKIGKILGGYIAIGLIYCVIYNDELKLENKLKTSVEAAYFEYSNDSLNKLEKLVDALSEKEKELIITIKPKDKYGNTKYIDELEDKTAENILKYLTSHIKERKEIYFGGLDYKIIISPITGKRWLDRNLGATKVCTSSTDTDCYGDYYQWGRLADGHEKTSSIFTSEKASNISRAGSSFIIHTISPYDWKRSGIDDNGNERTIQWNKIDGTGVCPAGFRVPTASELGAETIDYTGVDNTTTGAIKVIDPITAFQNFLKFPNAGSRSYFDGFFYNQYLGGRVWTNSVYESNAYFLDFSRNRTYLSYSSRANGFSVRCVEN